MENTTKKMYKEPKTDIAAIEAAMNICHVSADRHVKVNNDTPPFNGKVI